MAVTYNSITLGRQEDYAFESFLGYIVRLYQKNKIKRNQEEEKTYFDHFEILIL